MLIDIDPILENIEKIRTDQIWSTIIAGNKDVDISALIKELNNSAWVSQGRQFLSVGSNVCPFCQKETITDMFRDKLESFFDTEYERRVDKVKNLSSQYSSYANEIVKVFNEIIQNTYSVKIGGLNTELYQSKVDLLKSAYQGHEERITNKISEPGMKIDIPSVRVQVDEIVLLLENANTRIETHNSLVAQHDVEEKKLTNDVWARCIYEAATIIKRYQKEMQKIEKAIDGLTKSYKLKKQEADKLREEIIEKEKNITSVQPTINDINCILQAYGFTNFSIQAAEGEENRYCIKRADGTVAVDTLSEGEETFLTFLYFMQVVKGAFEREHISDKKIVVLDDPVSSLDSNVLYVVSTMIKELANNIRDGEGDVNQLFVLTHNAFFHKEVSFIDGRTKRRQDTNYWIIRKNKGISTIQPYGMENPISTSYELLWKEIRENTGITPISIQNTMRRIIENYFGILGSRRDDFLIEKFDTKEDKLICRSLLSWINDGSHSITDDISIDTYGDTVSRYKEVFRKLFEKSGHLPHYNMMMGISDAKSHEC